MLGQAEYVLLAPLLALRVLTYNVNYANPDVPATLDAIASADADVVLLQEITDAWQRALATRFHDKYPHQIFRVHSRAAGGLAVLSKVKIASEELWAPPAGGAWFPAQRLVVDAPWGAVQILNVHLRPALDSRGWVTGYLTTPPIRRAEIEAHWKKIDPALPTLVAGDFNEVPDGKAVTFLVERGLVRTPTRGPTTWHYARGRTEVLKLDIDHVMLDQRLVAKGGEVLDAGASDHRPVVVSIEPAK